MFSIPPPTTRFSKITVAPVRYLGLSKLDTEVSYKCEIPYLPGSTKPSNVAAGDGLSRQSDAKDQRYIHLHKLPVRRAVTCTRGGPYYVIIIHFKVRSWTNGCPRMEGEGAVGLGYSRQFGIGVFHVGP